MAKTKMAISRTAFPLLAIPLLVTIASADVGGLMYSKLELGSPAKPGPTASRTPLGPIAMRWSVAVTL